MNVDQIKVLRESYMKESTRPDGRKSTVGEYMRFITDCNLEFVTSKDLVMTDDAKSVVHCVCMNEDPYTQCDYPVKIISAAYEDIHAVEAIMSKENFESFLNSGYFNEIDGFSANKKDFMIKWSRNIKMQAQQPVRATPYYDQKPFINHMNNTSIPREDGIINPTEPATLAKSRVSIISNENDLITALENGNEVVLASDMTLNDSISINGDKTIDLNGYTITSSNGKRTFTINGGNVVIKNGKVKGVGNDAFFLNGIIADGGSACSLTLSDDVDVIADDCCVLLKGPDVVLNTTANLESIGEYAAVQGNGSHGGITVNINGGTIKSKDVGVYFPSKTTLNISGDATIIGSTGIYHKSGNLNIESGFICGNGDKVEYTHNPNGCNSTGNALVIEACNYPDGVPVVSITGGIFASVNNDPIGFYQQSDEYKLDNEKFITAGIFSADVSKYVVPTAYCVSDGNKYYIKDVNPNAISCAEELGVAINNNAELTIANDITLSETVEVSSGSVTLDMGGHTLTGAEGNRVFTVKSGDVCVNNGTIVAKNNDAFYLNGIVKEGGNAPSLTLGDDVNVIADDCCVLLKGPGAEVVTKANLTSTGEYAAIQGNGSHGGINVTIAGGNIKSNDVGVYFPCKTNLNITGGAIFGTTGVYHKSGNLNISGGMIYGTGDKVEYTHNPNGCNSTGDALVIEACNYPDGVPVVSITGGGFISKNANPIGYYKQSDKYSLADEKFIKGGSFNNKNVSKFIADGYYAMLDNGVYDVKTPDEFAGVYAVNGKTLVLDENTDIYLGNTEGTIKFAVFADGEGSVIDINAGTYNAGGGASNVAVCAKNGSIINIHGGKFTVGTDENDLGNSCVEANGATINIDGGYFECLAPYNGKYWVLNKKDNSGAKIVVSGGTFVNFDPSNGGTENPEESFLAPGCYVVKNGNEYTVHKAEYTNGITVLAGEENTINTSVVLGSTNGVNSQAVCAEGEGAVLNIEGGYYDGGYGASNIAVYAKEGAVINISDGRFTVGSDADGLGNSCVEANGATINISGGYFESAEMYNGKYWVLNKKDNSGAKIVVTGGTFVNFDPSNGGTENPEENFVAEGYYVEQEGNNYIVKKKPE